MTLAHGTDRLESARLVLRRVTSNDLPFFTRLHALPDVGQLLYPGGRPRSPEETAARLKYALASYEQWALGYLAVLRKEDGALIGRLRLDGHDGRIRGTRARDSQRMVRARTGARGRRAAAVAVRGHGHSSAERPLAARRRTRRRASGRTDARGRSHGGSLGVASS